MDICVNIPLIYIFSLFFWFLITILSYTLIVSTSQLQARKMMTSQSHTEYLQQTYNILVLIYIQNR